MICWDKLRTPSERRYDERGRLLHRKRHEASPTERYVDPVVSPYVAAKRLTALEGWLEHLYEMSGTMESMNASFNAPTE